VLFTAKVEAGANVVVFGLGGIGLNVIQAAKMVGADKIIGVDINPAREPSRKFGMTHFINPNEVENVVDHIVQLTDGGADYSFECIGNTKVMRQALECTTRAGASRSSSAWPSRRKSPPGRSSWSRAAWKGSAFGGARPHRRAEDRRLVHGRQAQHRRPDHPHAAARAHQRRLRPDEGGESIRSVVLY
jgi:S-(hydroxymethyl)glutathione dehydrogenase/alcohol dehydrogenase